MQLQSLWELLSDLDNSLWLVKVDVQLLQVFYGSCLFLSNIFFPFPVVDGKGFLRSSDSQGGDVTFANDRLVTSDFPNAPLVRKHINK